MTNCSYMWFHWKDYQQLVALTGLILRRLSDTSPIMKGLVICIQVKRVSVKDRVKL